MPEECTALNCCSEDIALAYEVDPSTQFMVTTSVLPEGISSTAGDGFYDPGDSVTVIATAELGYEFVGWFNNGGEKVGEAFSYTFTIYNSQILQARFIPE